MGFYLEHVGKATCLAEIQDCHNLLNSGPIILVVLLRKFQRRRKNIEVLSIFQPSWTSCWMFVLGKFCMFVLDKLLDVRVGQVVGYSCWISC